MDAAGATRLAKQLARSGFLALGGFHPVTADAAPEAAPGKPTRTLLLIGNAGPALWNILRDAPESRDIYPDPLDRFTRRILTEVAEDFGLGVAFPFGGPPWHPFQRWALKVGHFSPSPVGVLAHAVYGPWVAFRAALLSQDLFGTFQAGGRPGPCVNCRTKPCIQACPAEALSEEHGYDVPRCRVHVTASPGAVCLTGCLARRACPVGMTYAQTPDQAKFHMTAFLGSNPASIRDRGCNK